MQSNAARLGIGAAAIAVVVILFVVLKGNDDDNSSTTTPTTTAASDQSGSNSGSGQSGSGSGGQSGSQSSGESEIPTIEVKDAQPVGGIQDLTFTEGDDIRFRVDSDVSDEIHFHGYDVGEDVKAGGSVEFDVPATITGVFEVELEDRATQIAEITVNPS
jgi:hypothetical protein